MLDIHKTRMIGQPSGKETTTTMLSRFDRILERDRQTDRQTVSAITSPDRTGAKVYYQSGPDWYQSRPGLVQVRAVEASQPFGGQCPRLPLKNETGTNPYY